MSRDLRDLDHYDGRVAAPHRPPIRPTDWLAPRVRANPVENLLGLVDALTVEDWTAEAACATAGDPDAWFPRSGRHSTDTRVVLRICRLCPVARECFDYAMHTPGLQGIWAGTTAYERRNPHYRKESQA